MKRHWKFFLMPFFFFLILYLFNSYFFKDQSFQTFKDQLRSFTWKTLVLASLAFALQIFFQVGRLLYLIPFPISFRNTFTAFALGQSINCFIPFRTGDAVKAKLLATSHNDSFSKALGAIILDKAIDILSLLFLAFLMGIPFLRKYLTEQKEAFRFFSFGLLALLAIIGLIFLATRLPRIQKELKNFFLGFKAIQSPKKIFYAFCSSTFSWVSELVALIILCHTFGASLSFSSAFVALFILNLGIIAPVSVGNVGLHEVSLAFGLSQVGLGKTEALSVAIMHHGFQILVTCLLGLVALIVREGNYAKHKA